MKQIAFSNLIDIKHILPKYSKEVDTFRSALGEIFRVSLFFHTPNNIGGPLPNLLFFIPLQHRNLPDLLFIRIIFVLYYIFKTSSTNPSLNPNAIIAFQNFHISSFNGGSERGTNPAIPQKVCAKPAIR